MSFSMPFNSIPFNSGITYGIEYRISGISAVQFAGLLALGTEFRISGAMDVRLLGAADPARAQISSGLSDMFYAGQTDPARMVYAAGLGSIQIAAELATLHRDVKIAGISNVGFALAGIPGMEIKSAGVTGISIDVSALATREIYLSSLFASIIYGGFVDTVNRITETMYLNVSLAPGQELVIDTRDYNVTIDGQNAIDSHTGEWIKLRPGSRKIDIQTGSAGQVVTKVLYTERWL